MNTLNSKQLMLIQNALDFKMRVEIRKPDTNYKEVSAMARLTHLIDEERRRLWHNENFGPYEDIANSMPGECFNYEDDRRSFTSDDIPF